MSFKKITEAEIRAILHFHQQRADICYKTTHQFQLIKKSNCTESKDTSLFIFTKIIVFLEREKIC